MESPVFVAGDRELARLIKELRDLQPQYGGDTHSFSETVRKGERLVRRCMRTLKSRAEDQLAVTTCIWLLCRLMELDPSPALGQAMVDAGLPGILVQLLRSAHIGDWARQYAAALSSQLCSIAFASSDNANFRHSGATDFSLAGMTSWDANAGSVDFGTFDLSSPLDVLGVDAGWPGASATGTGNSHISISADRGSGAGSARNRVLDGSFKEFDPYQLSPNNYPAVRSIMHAPAASVSPLVVSPSSKAGSASWDQDVAGQRPASVDSLLVGRLRRTLIETKQVEAPPPKVSLSSNSGSSKCLDAVMASPYATARCISVRDMFSGQHTLTGVKGVSEGEGRSDHHQCDDGYGDAVKQLPRTQDKGMVDALSTSLPSHIIGSMKSNNTFGVIRGSKQQSHRAIASAKPLFSQSGSSLPSSSRFPALVPRGNNKAEGSKPAGFSSQLQHMETEAYSSFTYDPGAVYADMTADLARLDPLCLNLSVRIHDGVQAEAASGGMLLTHSTRTRALSASAASRGSRRGTRNRGASLLSASMSGKRKSVVRGEDGSPDSSPSPQKKLAPLMTLEHLVDTSFMRNLFVYGTTLDEAQALILKMEEVFKMFDAECDGVLTWEVFTKLLLSLVPERVLRGDVLDFLSAQAENPNSLVDYREFCSSGKVLVIGYRDADNVNKLSTMGWIARQQVVTGDPSTYSWKHHVEWFRDRKAASLIWLLRRAGRAILSVGRRELATKYLLFQGERVRSLSYLMGQGKKALGAAEVARKASLQLQKRAVHARRWATNLHETQRFLNQIASNAIENEIMALRRREIQALRATGEYVESEEEKFEQDPLLVEIQYKEACRSVYNKVFELQYKQRIAQAFLQSRGKAGLKLFHEQTAASRWLKTLGGKLRDRYSQLDMAAEFLNNIGLRAMNQWKVHDRARGVLVKLALEAQQKYKKYLDAQQGLHRVATLALRREADLAALIELGRASLVESNEKDRRLRFKNTQEEALRFLQAIPRRIFAREQYYESTKLFLKQYGQRALRLQINNEKNAIFLKALGAKAVSVVQRQRKARADLFTLGERARLKGFQLTWMARPGNKDLIKAETVRVQQAETDVAIIRREWSVADRLRGELEDAFSYYALKRLSAASLRVRAGNRLHAYVEDDDVPIDDWVISRLDFRVLMCEGRLLQCAFFQPDEVFAALDSEGCGYVSFRDIWKWLSDRINANAGEITRVWSSSGWNRRMSVRSASPPRSAAQSTVSGGGVIETLRQIALGCSSRSGGDEASGPGSGPALHRVTGLSLEGIVSLEDRVLISLFHRLGARNLDA